VSGDRAWPAWCLSLLLAGGTTTASAQTPPPSGRRIQIEAGVAWTGQAALGTVNANLTAPDGSKFVLFSTSNDIGPTVGPDLRLALPISHRLRAEVAGSWSRADLRSRISGDFEGATGLTSTLRISVFSVEGSAVWSLIRRGRLETFLRAGGGWMRELTADNVLSADGGIASGGAGVKYWWRERDRGFLNHFGLRAEARLVSRSGGLSFGTNRRVITPGVTAGVMLGF
jgi:hypothetical protein